MEELDLFTDQDEDFEKSPLSVRMRPRNFDEFVGQTHLVKKGCPLRTLIDEDRLTSLILYGPPGCGKNALTNIIKEKTKARFVQLNAVTSGVQDIRRVEKEADTFLRTTGRRTIVFVDELHRFSRTQQDALLPSVETGLIVLIGATTENPYFYITSQLQSRSNIYELKPLSLDELNQVIDHALRDKERGLGKRSLTLDPDAKRYICWASGGDARKALNFLDISALIKKEKGAVLDLDTIKTVIQKKVLVYDRVGDAHYDTISAFIKSMRGSDPDATLYWLAKMIVAGEDPRFIARRIIICASEDVGNADPMALCVATSALHAVELVGMPEGKIPLAQAALYVACAPKSNRAYLGIKHAMDDVEKGVVYEVPRHLKDANYPSAKRLGRGEGYKYPHHYKDHWVDQRYLPDERLYYIPSDQGHEKKIKEWLEKIKAKRRDTKKD
jgi:putative ATPase